MRWTLSNTNAPSCTTFFDDMIIERGSITNAAAGLDQDVGCGTTAELRGNSVAPGESGIWSVTPFNGVTFTNPSDPNTTVTNIQPGINRLTWTISKPRSCICTAGCSPKQDTMTLTRTVTVTPANAGVDRIVCDAVTTVVGNQPTAAGGTGLWSTVSGTGVVTNPTSPVSAVSGLTFGQTTVFAWTISANGCTTPSTDSVSITRFARISAGADQVSTTGSATLTGSGNATADVTWTVTSGVGTLATPNALVTEVTGLGSGLNTFRLTFASCPDYFSAVSVTNQGAGSTPAPTAAPTLPTDPCAGGTLTGDVCDCAAGGNCVCGQGLATSVCNCGASTTCDCLAPLSVCNGDTATTVNVGTGVTTVNCDPAVSTCNQQTSAPTFVPSSASALSVAFALLAIIVLIQ